MLEGARLGERGLYITLSETAEELRGELAKVKEQLGAKTNWVDSNDLAMIFQGAYQSPFYRKLHQVLHDDLGLYQRLHAADGSSDDAGTQAAIDRLNAEWLELGRLEAQHRSIEPTRITRVHDQPRAPDMSREWN